MVVSVSDDAMPRLAPGGRFFEKDPLAGANFKGLGLDDGIATLRSHAEDLVTGSMKG